MIPSHCALFRLTRRQRRRRVERLLQPTPSLDSALLFSCSRATSPLLLRAEMAIKRPQETTDLSDNTDKMGKRLPNVSIWPLSSTSPSFICAIGLSVVYSTPYPTPRPLPSAIRPLQRNPAKTHRCPRKAMRAHFRLATIRRSTSTLLLCCSTFCALSQRPSHGAPKVLNPEAGTAANSGGPTARGTFPASGLSIHVERQGHRE